MPQCLWKAILEVSFRTLDVDMDMISTRFTFSDIIIYSTNFCSDNKKICK